MMSDPRRHLVLLVDDHPITRLGLRYAFEHEPDFRVCDEAYDIGGALDALAHRTPDLVVTDLALEGRSGLELVKQIRTHYADLPTLVLSMYDARLYARRALEAGARGYVEKTAGHAEVVRAARAIINGETYLGSAPSPTPPCTGPTERDAAIAALTDRELEVFLLLGQGYAPRHVAEALRLSVSTVEAYRERLKAKLGVEDSALLLRYAVGWMRDHEHGLAA